MADFTTQQTRVRIYENKVVLSAPNIVKWSPSIYHLCSWLSLLIVFHLWHDFKCKVISSLELLRLVFIAAAFSCFCFMGLSAFRFVSSKWKACSGWLNDSPISFVCLKKPSCCFYCMYVIIYMYFEAQCRSIWPNLSRKYLSSVWFLLLLIMINRILFPDWTGFLAKADLSFLFSVFRDKPSVFTLSQRCSDLQPWNFLADNGLITLVKMEVLCQTWL